MRIEINIKSSKEAELTIDGREMKVVRKGAETRLEGLEYPDTDSTFAGIIASKIFSSLHSILDAFEALEETVLEEATQSDTWKVLPERTADMVYDLLVYGQGRA